jgi:hypothetical protein
MNQQIEQLKHTIEPLREEILHHKVYSIIRDLDDLKIFMQYHIYAVWDFMSLLKALQNNLTCTSIPWFPKGSADTRFLINEIVVGEESDVDLDGVRKSHFEIYKDAMEQCGADTTKINLFIDTLRSTNNLNLAYREADIPEEAKNFVDFTFQIIGTNEAYKQAAIFTFGREDLIPGMFHSIVQDIYKNFPNNISIFKYYLERHIEVDGEHHSKLALQMIANLCDKNLELWDNATQITVESLRKRIELWDGAYHAIIQKQKSKLANH